MGQITGARCDGRIASIFNCMKPLRMSEVVTIDSLSGHQNASTGGHSLPVVLGSASGHECADQVGSPELLSLDIYGSDRLLFAFIHSLGSQPIRLWLYVQQFSKNGIPVL